MPSAAIPKTLTRQEFQRTPAASRGGTFQQYLRYVAKRRGSRMAGRRAAAADPFAATPESVLRQRVETRVRGEIDPIVAEILRDTDAQAAGIEGVTSRYARNLAPYAGQTQERYARGSRELAAVAEAMANRTGAAGAQLSSELSGKLGAINAPAAQVAQVAGGAAQFGRGAANAGFAHDSAALEALIARGIGEEQYAAQLPAFAQLEGIGHIGDLRGEAQGKVSELRGKVPSLVEELLAEERKTEFDKAVARAGFQQDEEERRLRYAPEPAEPPMPNASLSNSLGYLVDQYGTPILRDGKPVPAGSAIPSRRKAAKPKAAAAAVSPAKRAQIRDSAYQDAVGRAAQMVGRTKRSAGAGGKLVPGSPQQDVPDPVPFPDAYRQIALYLRGRMPWLTSSQVAALTRQVMDAVGYRPPQGIPRG